MAEIRIHKTAIFTIFLIALALFIASCAELDTCDPPFSVGIVPYLGKGRINAGQDVGIGVVIVASSISRLDDIEIIMSLPPELDITSITQPKNGPNILRENQTIKWKSCRKQTRFGLLLGRQWQESFYVWVKSKTAWELWSQPVKVSASLTFKAVKDECTNFPNGTYKKTITWSSQGVNYPELWEIAPDGYRGIWKKSRS